MEMRGKQVQECRNEDPLSMTHKEKAYVRNKRSTGACGILQNIRSAVATAGKIAEEFFPLLLPRLPFFFSTEEVELLRIHLLSSISHHEGGRLENILWPQNCLTFMKENRNLYFQGFSS